MLKYFSVEGFKNFKNKFELDFSDIREYKFNNHCIKNDLLNKIIIYGKNSVGKSNIGLALFDVTTHTTEKNVTPNLYDFYLNTDKEISHAIFEYKFVFKDNEIYYTYKKSDTNNLVEETLYLNDEKLFSYNFKNSIGDFDILKKYTPSLNFQFKDNNVSILKYIVNNSIDESIEPLKEMVKFLSDMLWFRSLDENRYIGYKSDSSDYLKFIFEGNNLNEFQEFLLKAGINEKLTKIKNPTGDYVLYFDKVKPIPFLKVASNGTKALYTLFYWLKTGKNLSFLFIDEFDAYYHVELAETIVEMLEEMNDFQTILTSHNTNLLSNKIMRPDCYFILSKENLVSFANATDRELREGHNLSKLYMSGEFDE